MGCRTILPAFSGEDQFRGADRFLDRPDVPDAVKQCVSAGIQVKIVTGDTPGTAREIGRQIGLWQLDTTLSDLQLITNFGLKNSPPLGNKATFQIGSPNLQYD